MKVIIASEILQRQKGRSEVESKKGPKDGSKGNNKSIGETVCLEVSGGGEIRLLWPGLFTWWGA